MSDFDPPSFSLGLEFDLHSPLPPPPSSQSVNPNILDSIVYDTDDEFQPNIDVSNVEQPINQLKRLKRGPKSPIRGFVDSVDDDIEDFSDEDKNKVAGEPENQCHSLASSSKLPLHRHGVLTSKPGSRLQLRKPGYAPHSMSSDNIGSNCKEILATQKSISPVRRFQLIDSDSDDSLLDDILTKDANEFGLPGKASQSNLDRNATIAKKETEQVPAANMSCREDLWKDFFPEKSVHIPTPAFDEVCKEYFSSVNDKNPIQNKSSSCSQTSNFRNKRVQQFNQNPQLPAHSYFFHDDTRIQKLIRERLPNFSPIGAETCQGYQNHDVSAFDYISQFGHGESSRAANRHPREVNPTKGRKNTRKAKGVMAQEPENWINPKNSAGISKETGQRSAQAGEKSAGHWFTNAEGRKVYISKNGKEMTGQLAYRNYRKESGVGYKKSKKKTTTKKKAAARKK
ncbi:GTPase-activating protein [Lithospermum erythrorhizon]|uniref:GTPase-activating protein n=1 Tax=Lithospermum erythrorhizon TaxID=34254 RepID=A0AAV3Q3N8_LITER